ncbi:MAG TPA: hypothetical protein VKB09_04185 [Thermomicrobiales bacterium]|nr:hypothetical protein [Thermomicrobiales bacterium]
MAETRVRDVVEELEISDDEAGRLIAKYIRQDPNHPGRHEAWADIGSDGAPVWHLILHLRGAGLDGVLRDRSLPEEAVLAAIAFYQQHRELFEAKLLLEAEKDSQWKAGRAEGWITDWQPVNVRAE